MLTGVSEDMGGQEKLMFSPAHIRKFLFPGMKRRSTWHIRLGRLCSIIMMVTAAECCPSSSPPASICSKPLQWRCKDIGPRGAEAPDFGNQIVFHGGMDNQFTLPFGTLAEVEQEVMDNLRILGAEGGYILAPCHSIQSVTRQRTSSPFIQQVTKEGGFHKD